MSDRTDESDAVADLVAVAVDDFRTRVAAGEDPDPEEYAARHPAATDILRRVLGRFRPRPVGPESAPDAPGGGQLGDYRIVREVGRGGMGVVYEAEQISLRRRVALKVLPFAAVMDPRHLQRFQNEARAAAGLDHPHVVKVHAVGQERGVHYIAMQFIDGQTLADLIAERRDGPATPPVGGPDATRTHAADGTDATVSSPPASPPRTSSAPHAPGDAAYFRRVAGWGVDAADALEHAHAVGVVHRDVKPGNLLLDGAGTLFVADFGLAKLASDPGMTGTGDLLGTVRYMSPEQASSRHDLVDHRSDVYSLGITLYELLTLCPAFDGRDRQEILSKVTTADPVAPRSVNRSVPRDLETVVLKATEKDPSRRYQSAKEFADDLGRFLGGEGVKAKRQTVRDRVARWVGRRPWSVAATVLVGMLALGTLAFWDRERTQAVTAAEQVADEAESLLRARRYSEALTVARRAEERLPRFGATTLRARVNRLTADAAFGEELEGARLEQVSLRADQSGFDRARAIPRYRAAFLAYGVDVLAGDEQSAADALTRSAVRTEAAAALDDWATELTDPEERSRLERLSDAVGDDRGALVARVRRASRAKNFIALKQLLAEAEVDPPPPAVLTRIAASLPAAAWPDAVPMLRAGQLRYPDDLWANCYLAQVLYWPENQRRAGEAVEFYRVAVSLRPRSPGLWVNLAAALNAVGRYPEAETTARRAIELDPDQNVAHYNLGQALYKQKRNPEALEAARRAVTLREDWQTRFLLGVCSIQVADWPGAEAALRRSVELNPQFAVTHHWLGVALNKQGRLPAAEAALRRSVELDPRDAECYFDLGTVLLKQGNLADAETAYRRAIELKPDYTDALINLGSVFRRQDKLADAEAVYRQVLTHAPTHGAGRVNLGALLAIRGRLPEAETEFRRATEDHPNLFVAHYSLGTCLGQQGKLAEAEASFRRAVGIQPESAEAHCDLGHALRGQKRYPEALAAFRQGHELGSRRPDWRTPTGAWIKETERLAGEATEQRWEVAPPPRPVR